MLRSSCLIHRWVAERAELGRMGADDQIGTGAAARKSETLLLTPLIDQ